ncbi:MAG: metal ABC transporter ATP-binding protein, partial [Spirochaeta sp.]
MILFYSHRRECQAARGAAALELTDLYVRYPRTQADAVAGVSMVIPRATKTALVGHNGSGKSTIMKAVCGILPVRSGEVRIYGLPIGGCHHRVAFLPQRGEINWRFPVTVERLVLAGRYVHLGWIRRPRQHDYDIARDAMHRMGIAHLADRQIGMLSGGQQQRALLARALAQDAELLLLDEP